jgi:hypothetical protein
MAVCFAYFDVSGHPDEHAHREYTVGGLVAREGKWRWFDAKWKAVLDRYGVECFEASKMAHWSKPYSAWALADGSRDEPKRIRYIRDLTRAIKTTVYKAFSHSVSLDDYDAVNAEYRLDELCKPFGLCAAQIMRNVAIWMANAHPKDDVLFIFEDGDADRGDLERVLARRNLKAPYPPQFMPKRWKNAAGTQCYLRPFEACDFWAYEEGLAFRLVGTGKTTRLSSQHLDKQVPNEKHGYSEEGLRAICEGLDVPRR